MHACFPRGEGGRGAAEGCRNWAPAVQTGENFCRKCCLIILCNINTNNIISTMLHAHSQAHAYITTHPPVLPITSLCANAPPPPTLHRKAGGSAGRIATFTGLSVHASPCVCVCALQFVSESVSGRRACACAHKTYCFAGQLKENQHTRTRTHDVAVKCTMIFTQSKCLHDCVRMLYANHNMCS